MTRLRRLLAPVLLLGAGAARPALAQTPPPLSFEVRGGAGIPFSDFDDDIGVGWSVGATVRYPLDLNLDGFAGFEFASFPPDEQDPDVDFTVRDLGFRAGIRSNLHLSGTAVAPWAEASLLVIRSSVKASDGSTSATVNADWAVGFEGGVGVSVPVAPRVSLTPGVRYRRHTAKFEDAGKANVDYFVVDVGVNVRL